MADPPSTSDSDRVRRGLAELSPQDKRALLAAELARRAAQPRRYPLSFGQRRLWFLDRFAPGDPVYNMPIVLRLHGRLRIDALQRALDAVVARHAVLRTTFVEAGDEPVQLVARTGGLPLTVVDAEDDASARRLVAEQARAPFELSTGPLARAVLIHLAGRAEHLLQLTLHHIICDGASIDLLLVELNALYTAHLRGEEPDLPPLPVQYGDYAVWQRQRLAGAELERQLAHVTRTLAGAPALLGLPADHPRPAVQSYRGDAYPFPLDPDVAARVQRLSRQAGCTPFMTVLAAFQLVLARYSGLDDIVVGTPVAGRTHPELDRLIGLFVNTLALRTSLRGDPTFAELIERVRETTLDALSHQDVPFERLVEALQPERSLAHAPLFQVQLIFQHELLPKLSAPDLVGRIEGVHTGTAKFDLTLYAQPRPDGMMMELEYNTDLFGIGWVRRFADSLRAVLDAVTARPELRVGDVDLMPATERDRVLAAPNRTARPVPVPTALALLGPRLWGPGAEPDRVVATAGGTTLSAGQLASWSARLARTLADAGAGPDSLVGLCVNRGVRLLAGLVGIWRAGAAYVPLDPAFPVQRLRLMAADAGLRVVVTETELRGLVEEVAPDVRVLCVDAAEVLDAVPDPPGPRLAGAHLAYTIFTSGSTGRPKGVAVPHAAVANLLCSFAADLGLGRLDCLVAVTTLSFDIAILELALPLLVGARLVVASRDEAADPDALRALLTASGASALQATPATWRMLVAGGGVPSTVRLRLCGGEALPRDLATALLTDGARLWNVYGPTETTVWSAAGPVAAEPAPVVVGPAIANTRVYLLDNRLQPVPVGVVGEVHLAGLGLARGYHGRAALTAERFLPDPYGGPGGRMYRTGDLARWRPDLTLELLGRADHQVKVRGFRIETAEIENVLCGHAAVRQAVVTAATVDGDVRLVAHVVPQATGATAAELWPDLQRHLRRWLPEYMVPAALLTRAELPLTPNGKVDRGALPQPQWGDIATTRFVAPSTPAERAVAKIWAEVLNHDAPIGVHDDFFALGGHSLSATQVIARIRALLGVNLRLRTLFAGPTVAQLAAAVAADPSYHGDG